MVYTDSSGKYRNGQGAKRKGTEMKREMEKMFCLIQNEFDEGLPLRCEDVLSIINFYDPNQRVQIHTGLFRLYSVNPILPRTAMKRLNRKDAIQHLNSFQCFEDIIYLGI